MRLFSGLMDSILDEFRDIVEKTKGLPEEDVILLFNKIKQIMHKNSPFCNEPVDCVLWVRYENVSPNYYNPNTMMSPEVKLLKHSIEKDHITQPIVANVINDGYKIVDGEHRYLTIKENNALKERTFGYVPVSITNSKTDRERMASTIRHNRARGVHKLDNMTNIVLIMIADGWGDNDIARELGMDADEILRIKQVSGIAKAFERPHYNRAWIADNGQETIEQS